MQYWTGVDGGRTYFNCSITMSKFGNGVSWYESTRRHGHAEGCALC
jgi:hypothetical protein